MPVIGSLRRTVAHDAAVTIDTTVRRLAIGNVRGTAAQSMAEEALITSNTVTMRWRDDGTDPTSTAGHRAFANTIIHLINRNRIDAFRYVRDSTATANGTLEASFLA
mgnify:CR=1 FL=1